MASPAIENEASSFIENEASSFIENEASSFIENEASSFIENEASSFIENEASSSIQYFDKFGYLIHNTCTYCNDRHSCDKTHVEVQRVYDNDNCKEFVVGDCFKCRHYLDGDESYCDDVFYPAKCKNFIKEID